MTYERFKTEVLQRVREQTPEHVIVGYFSAMKNNAGTSDRLIFKTGDISVSPVISVQEYFREFGNCDDLDSICRQIAAGCQEMLHHGAATISGLRDYDSVKDRIVCQLISRERNRELLSEVLHCRFHDLAVVFRYMWEDENIHGSSALLCNNCLSVWGITLDELYRNAREVTPVLLPAEFLNIMDILGMACGVPAETHQEIPLYVLSNSDQKFGAGCIMYPGLLEHIAEQFGEDLIILPSSIHEVVIVPGAAGRDLARLRAMVHDINEAELAAEEILSNNVYGYSRSEKRLFMYDAVR